MKLNFFAQLGIQTGIAIAAQIIHNSKATPEHQKAANDFIMAAQTFIASFSTP